MEIGVLAVQGAFAEHESVLDSLNVGHHQIRNLKDLDLKMDALIIPGGESTVIGKLLREQDMLVPLREMIQAGLPVFGTCAGMILLSDAIVNDNRTHLATFPAVVRRNAFGRQLGSFSYEGEFKGIGNIPMEFIRAPIMESIGSNAESLAEVDGKIVAAKCGNQLVTAFHPELTTDFSVHSYFIKMVEAVKS